MRMYRARYDDLSLPATEFAIIVVIVGLIAVSVPAWLAVLSASGSGLCRPHGILRRLGQVPGKHMESSEILWHCLFFTSRIEGDRRIVTLIPFRPDGGVCRWPLWGDCLRLIRHSRFLPRILRLSLPFICLMILSISYSPAAIAGAESIKVYTANRTSDNCPLFRYEYASRIHNFFITLLILCSSVNLEPLLQIGEPITDDGDGRLMTTGGTTIEFRTSAVAGVTIILFVVLPQLSKGTSSVWYYFKKVLLYLVIAVFVLALIGAGARSATISLVAVVLLNVFFYRHRIPELLFMACLAASSLLFVDIHIPENSLEYLGTLIHSKMSIL